MLKIPICLISLSYGVKYDGITHMLLHFSYNLFFGKHVLDISVPNVPIIDGSSFIKILTLKLE